jgi:hypothetical protein
MESGSTQFRAVKSITVPAKTATISLPNTIALIPK